MGRRGLNKENLKKRRPAYFSQSILMILAGISIKRVKKVKRHSSEPGASLCTVSCTHCITLGFTVIADALLSSYS